MGQKVISLKGKINLVLLLIVFSVIMCWGLFFFSTLERVDTTNQELIAQVSDRVIDTMESAFLDLERAAVTLSVDEDVRAVLAETNPLSYHARGGELQAKAYSIYQANSLVEDILLYDAGGVYCRLRGKLGNTSAARVQFLLGKQQASQHIVTTLEQQLYVGYITSIVARGETVGYLVFLMQDDRIRSLFSQYDSFGALQIALIAEGNVIAASDKALNGISLQDFCGNASSSSVRQVGLTPFKIVVADYGQTIRGIFYSFLFSICVTTALLSCLLFFLYRFLHHLFFTPMLAIMDNARQIGAVNDVTHLDLTGQPEFDELVGQINSMVTRLDEHSQSLFAMEYEVQHTELERQRAILISLKKQINAHFTVNTVNVIRRLSETGQQQKASEMCEGLAHLLRYANNAEDYIGGMDEMLVLEKYLEIMQLRYPSKVTVEFDIDEQFYEVYMPRMLVQPLVENAITHGLGLASEAGKITITAKVEDTAITIAVADSGSGMDSPMLRELRDKIAKAPQLPWSDIGLERIALPNIQKRVAFQFGEQYGLTVQSALGQGTTVTLRLPKKT